MLRNLVPAVLIVTASLGAQQAAPVRGDTVRSILAPTSPLPAEAASAGVTRFSFIAYGDTRGRRDGVDPQYEHSLVVESMLRTIAARRNSADPVKFILQSGDAVVNGRDVNQWNVSYVGLVNRLTQEGGVPYFLAPGNHDVTSAADLANPGRREGLRNYLAAMAKLIPNNGAPRRLDGYPTFAFGFGNTFVLGLDSNIPDDSVQLAWARAQLAGLDRNRYTHIVAFFHHPPFSSGPHGGSNVERQAASIRAKWMPVFRRYNVDLMYTGHEHLFEHWVERWRGADGRTRRMDQIVSGGGGAPLYAYFGEPDTRPYLAANVADSVRLEHLVKPGMDAGENAYHYVVVHVDGARIWQEVIGVDWGRNFAPYRSARSLLGDTVPAAPPSSSITAFTGATLIDGTDRAPIGNATIVVQNGRIAAAGPAGNVSVPAGAERVSFAGKFVIPGLVNAHGHVNAPADLGTYAAYGVTSVYSLGGEPASVMAARAAQAADGASLTQSRLWVAGPVLTPRTPDEARAQVADLVRMRADIAKIRVDDNLGTTAKMTPEVYTAVIEAAHANRLRVAIHLFYLSDAKAVLAAGGDLVAHSVRDLSVDNALIATLKTKGVCVSPTLMREVSTFVYESVPDFFADPLFLRHANAQWVATLREPARQESVRASTSAQRYKAALDVASRNLKSLADAGVVIAMGTDTGPMGRFQGYFELMELELMAKAGLSPRQVLRAATRDAARCMRVDADVGTVETGKWGDFVVLDANPLENISNVRRISSVWIAGHRVPR